MPGVILMAALTDLLLLVCLGKLMGERIPTVRIIVSSAIGGLYSGLCLLLPLGHWSLWLLSHCFLCWYSFGTDRALPRRCLIFVALTVLAESTGSRNGLLPMALSGLCLWLSLGFRENILPVKLIYGEQTVTCNALRDTGNTLKDPITGGSVLVVSAEVAERLTGLSQQQLCDPLQTLGQLPGLRLIPYQSVSGRGFLLGLPLKQVQIGAYRGSFLVALAPVGIGNENYQALTGGTL